MTQLETRFAALADEWTALCNQSRSDSARWEQLLSAIAREEEQLRDAGRWLHGRADYLGVIGKHRDELVHSRMIGWLLDPCGHHGLGTQVLSTVLEYTDLLPRDPAILARTRVSLEVPIGEGRMDIVVEARGLYLVIENKVDAVEGPGQCAYYLERVQHPDRRFIFLTPDGRDPDSAPEFRTMGYGDFADLLEQVLGRSRKGAIGFDIAAAYLRTLRLEFE
jgi:hypothetical protein